MLNPPENLKSLKTSNSDVQTETEGGEDNHYFSLPGDSNVQPKLRTTVWTEMIFKIHFPSGFTHGVNSLRITSKEMIVL